MSEIVYGFVTRATENQIETAMSCLSILETTFKIFNIPQHRPETYLKNTNILPKAVVSFGVQASSLVNDCIKDTSIIHKILPSLKQLESSGKNIETRKEAHSGLLQLKEVLTGLSNQTNILDIVIDEKDLLEISSEKTLMIKKIVNQKQLNSLFYITQGKEIISIGNEKPEKSDIHLSFEELFVVKNIIEILKPKEVILNKQTEKKGK